MASAPDPQDDGEKLARNERNSIAPPDLALQSEPQARVRVVTLAVSIANQAGTVDRILAWSAERKGRYVCVANVHMVMEAYDSPAFSAIVNRADLIVADGMPLVWAQRLLGHREASRVFGPHLTEEVLKRAAALGIPVAFYGGSEVTLHALRPALLARWPALHIAAAIAPPFRSLTPEEDAWYTAQLVGSGAQIVFVGIGCPKQERWMSKHVACIPAVMLGVGLAFDILAGLKREAPRWMQQAGLGWLHRLAQEPRRLWRRYAMHNPRFVVLLAGQWMRHHLSCFARRVGYGKGSS